MKEDKKTFEAYISKFALTKGIFKVQAEETHEPTMISVRGSSGLRACFHRGEWHLTLKEAAAKAEEMRIKKIISLRKKIAKLDELRFEVVTV